MLYNIIKLDELINHLSRISNTVITVYDTDFVVQVSSRKRQELCSFVGKNCVSVCRLSDKKALRVFREKKRSTYTCPAGLTETIVPLFKAESKEVFAYVIVGQYRAKETPTAIKNLQELCATEGLDVEYLTQLYDKAEQLSKDKIESVISVLETLLDYARLKKYVAENDNYFSSVIAPYVRAHLAEKITVESLCKALHISRQPLYKAFADNSNMTITQYVNYQRIIVACRMIEDTQTPLVKVAESVGIADYNYFIKLFKKQTGATPKRYAAIYRKNMRYVQDGVEDK